MVLHSPQLVDSLDVIYGFLTSRGSVLYKRREILKLQGKVVLSVVVVAVCFWFLIQLPKYLYLLGNWGVISPLFLCFSGFSCLSCSFSYTHIFTTIKV